VVSLADADRIVRQNAVLGLLSPEIRYRAMASVMPGFAAQMRTTKPDSAGQHYLRIMLRTRQQNSAEDQTELIGKIRERVDHHFPVAENADSPRPMTTGFFVLLSGLVDSVLADQNRTFLVACIFIALAMLVAFRSPVLAAAALVPNVLPIAGLLGTLGWLGIKLNMGAAMIAAVSLGLSIDGTIHYLTSYRHYRASGVGVAASIQRVQFRTGRAVIYATFALVIGFGSLVFSQFIPTAFFGGLVGLSMLGGLFGNLVVLPVLLTLFSGGKTDEQRTHSGRRRHSHKPSGSGAFHRTPLPHLPTSADEVTGESEGEDAPEHESGHVVPPS
jgi:predicted RND superfamily exporter protein